MLIDATYFVGEINIPGTGNLSIQERLDIFIETKEEELLLTLLGYELYRDLTAGLTAEAPEQKWKDLKNGKEYNDTTGKLRKWNGLIKGTPPEAYSLIALYVYYWWMRDKASQTTPIGEAENKSDTSDLVSPAVKMSRAWNEMSRWIDELFLFLESNKDVYPQWDVDVYALKDEFSPINVYNL